MNKIEVREVEFLRGEACLIINCSDKAFDLSDNEIVLNFEDGSSVAVSAENAGVTSLPAGKRLMLWAGESPPKTTEEDVGMVKMPRGFLMAGSPEVQLLANSENQGVVIEASTPALPQPSPPKPTGSSAKTGLQDFSTCTHCEQPLNVVGICVNTECSGK